MSNENLDYFGFRDLHGFKDYLVYVYAYAPNLFPAEDWQKPDEQMTLERAFKGFRLGIEVSISEKGERPVFNECRKLIEDAYADYLAGNDLGGQHKLEAVERLLKKVHTR